MDNSGVIFSIFLMAFIIFFTRILPFLFFRKKHPPVMLNYVEENVPPLIMVLLVMYCLKDVKWGLAPYGLPELIGIGMVAFIHWWRNNALLSIVSGTALYILALKIM